MFTSHFCSDHRAHVSESESCLSPSAVCHVTQGNIFTSSCGDESSEDGLKEACTSKTKKLNQNQILTTGWHELKQLEFKKHQGTVRNLGFVPEAGLVKRVY